jgi:mono/diheme cytochrome c family protein
MMPRPFSTTLASLIAALCALATADAAEEDKQGWNPDTTFPALAPAEALKTIQVPAGFHLQCIASEPMVEEPTAFAYDGNGALYVCEWRSYMQDEHATDQNKPVSRVVKLVDSNADGIMDKRTVFIDGVILPRMVLPLHDRVLVSFSNDTTVWAYFDDNRDGVADRHEAVFEGRKNGTNIEHQGSGLIWNLDNTICTNDYRFSFKGGKLIEGRHSKERISQWGLARDDDGRLFASSAGAANPNHGFQLPAGYPIVDVREHGPNYRDVFSLCKVWDSAYDFENQRILTTHSSSSGQTILRSSLMPDWYGMHVVCEPVGRLLRLSRIDWNDGLGVATNVFPGSEFIRSSDAYFRPVWSANAPDGTLVFSDMYRGIIQEKAWFPTNLSEGSEKAVKRYLRVKKWGMVDVVRHGRIWRLVPDSRKPAPTTPKMLDETPTQLVAHLSNPDGWWRDTAQMLIVSRGDRSAIPALLEMAAKHADANARIHALWALHGLGALPKELVGVNLGHTTPRVRRAAVQLAESWLAAGDPDIIAKLGAMLGDADAHVRIQLFLAYRAAGLQIPAALTTTPNPIIAALLGKEQANRHKIVLSESSKQGEKIYESLCSACHGPEGKGVKQGNGLLAPPLNRSGWFRDNGNLGAITRILLKGQTGPIEGKTYGDGVMLPLENTYNDEQLAAVINFIGQRWNEWSVPATAAQVAAARAELAARREPFTSEELKKVPRQKRSQ